MAIGKLDNAASHFVQICTPGSGWHVITVSAFDMPAYTGEKVPEELMPLLISPDKWRSASDRAHDGFAGLGWCKPRKLLVLLALRLGERVSSDALIDALWGQDSESDRVNALQVLISYLRKALSSAGSEARIETVDGGYRLVAPRDAVDAYRLESAVLHASDVSDLVKRLATLETALQSWRGSPIPEVANENFAQADLHRLNELRLAAIELRIETLLALGRHREAVAELQQLVVVHPLRERFYVQLMTALYRSGRQAEALSVYDKARTILVEELGLDPGPELQAAVQAVLTQSPQLHEPAPGIDVPASFRSGQFDFRFGFCTA